MCLYTPLCVLFLGQEKCVAVTQLFYIFSTNLPSYNVTREFVIRQSVFGQSNMPITIKFEMK